MQYQSFPGVRGGSRSLDKLKALRLTPLKGKRFLDVGCNEGFFCGYALFDGAAEVVGIDRSKGAISRAQTWFPECRFLAQSWDKLPEGKFDVILLASALHYADDQAALIHRLMGALADNGVLVLEMGIALPADTEWVSVERSIDERQFPTHRTLAKILNDYAWKMIGYSVQQAGDPIERYVIHVQHKKPYVYLLLEMPGSGKSTLARNLFSKAKVPVVRGDHLYMEISEGRIEAPEELARLIKEDCSTTVLAQVAHRVFSAGMMDDLVDVWSRQGGRMDFALDSYVPEAYHKTVKDAFIKRGYFPVVMSWETEMSMSVPVEADKKADAYMQNLDRRAAEFTSDRLNVSQLKSAKIKAYFRGWHLDHPVHGHLFEKESSLIVSGWGLPVEINNNVECYIRVQGRTETYHLDQRRPDVIKARLPGREDVPDAAYYCGFRLTVSAQKLGNGAEFGFLVNGERIPVAQLIVAKSTGLTHARELSGRLFRKIADLGRVKG